MKKIVTSCLLIFCIALSALMQSCGSVAITGRKQVLLFDSGQIASLSNDAYSEVMSTATLSKNTNMTKMVQDVGFRLSQAVISYMTQNGRGQQMAAYNWGFVCIDSKEVNAFCLPNGKVVAYEGIMPFASTADRLAVVIGHEMGHVIANHGNERMSQETIVKMVGAAGDAVLSGKSEQTRAIFNTAFGLGTSLGVLMPYSRTHEYEADRLGLIFMAMAGFDINQAPVFWEQMSQNSGPKPPEFLSTHPSDANRMARLRATIPEASQYAPRR
ncbi:MAG: M48 family metallopeptidase [Prevotellaceae bacterium]|jgi:predicted Zn-dependent protease|nr:M48 family metallopeptidase [Prevotellaceae bacterium]